MLTGKIRKEWSSGGKWLYMRHAAYLDGDKNLQTILLTGWSEGEVEEKTQKMERALTKDYVKHI